MYRQTDDNTVVNIDTLTTFRLDVSSKELKAYQAWLSKGNIALPMPRDLTKELDSLKERVIKLEGG